MPAALRAALTGAGPAIFVGPRAADLPATVDSRVAVIVQSSGSTDKPKRVVLSTDALLASAAAAESALGGTGQWLLALPPSYIAGINVLIRSITADLEPVALPAGPFTAEAFVHAAARMVAGAKFTSLVPTQLARLLEHPAATAALRDFDRVLVGGQATPAGLVASARAAGISITRTYGSSETSGGCVWDGLALASVTVRVIDGEIHLAGPVLAEGYLADPGRTAAAFVEHDGRRWFATGDAGALEAGVLRVTGRLDDVIISGGEKVSLGFLERTIRDATAMHDAVVVSERSEQWGEVPVVVTTIPMDLVALRALATERLGRAAAPSRIVVVDELPMLASGKPDRLAIQAAVAR